MLLNRQLEHGSSVVLAQRADLREFEQALGVRLRVTGKPRELRQTGADQRTCGRTSTFSKGGVLSETQPLVGEAARRASCIVSTVTVSVRSSYS